jgi:hypothetical protein
MTHINIDGEPEAVKKFFRSLELTPEECIVKMNGQTIAWMFPVDSSPDHVVDIRSASSHFFPV